MKLSFTLLLFSTIAQLSFAQQKVLSREESFDLPCDSYINCVKSGDLLDVLYRKEPFFARQSDSILQDGLSLIRTFYVRSLLFNSESIYSQDKVIELDARIKEETQIEIEEQYTKLLRVADQKFAQKDFVAAKELFIRAVTFKPSDPYPLSKIKEIDQILYNKSKE